MGELRKRGDERERGGGEGDRSGERTGESKRERERDRAISRNSFHLIKTPHSEQ